jgi:hypothetical protein
MYRLIYHAIAVLGLGAAVILDIDWDAVFAIVLGIGALGTVVLEHRRSSKLDDYAQSMGERLAALEAVVHESRDMIDRVARLEATSTDAMTVEQRIAGLEVRAERDQHMEERIAGIGERVAGLEAKGEMVERIARIEAVLEERTEE